MKIPFPLNLIMKQPNVGKLFGDIWASWNLDLTSNPGKIRISDKTAIITSSDDDADLGYPVAIKRSSADGTDRWWAICGTVLFKTTSSTPGSFTQDTIATGDGTPTDLNHLYSDMEDFNGALIVSKSGDLHRLSGGSWDQSWWQTTLGATALTSSIFIPLKKGFDNRLVIGDGQYCHVVDVNNNFTYKRLNFGSEYQVVKIKSSNSAYWISCRHKFSGKAKEFMWDGSLENYNYAYEVDSDYIFSGVIKDEIPHIINGIGELLKFNGAGFTAIAQLPIKNEKSNRWDDNLTISQCVHPNGMEVIDGNIHILLNAGINNSSSTLLENMLSGIWEYTKETGLYHKYPITKQVTNANDYGSPIITRAGALVSTDNANGKFMAGAGLYVADGGSTTTEIKVIIKLSSGSNTLAYFVSPQVLSSQVLENFDNLWATFKKLANATDYIQVKYRIEEKSFGDLDNGQICTWSDTDEFTSTISAWSNVAVGDEIEILSGEGSGLVSKVTAISESGGTYTITIADTVANASGTLLVRVLNWTHLDKFTDQNVKYQKFNFNKDATFFQFKVVLFGKSNSPEINRMILTSKAKIKAE